MTDNTQELDEIIDDAYEGEVSWTHDQLDGTSVLDDSLKDIDERKAETRQALLDWHNKQVEEAMAKFHLKKGVKYDVKASDSVIVITRTNKLKEIEDD